jgi:hypothetical protein
MQDESSDGNSVMDWRRKELRHDQRPNPIKWRIVSQISRSRYRFDIVDLSPSEAASDIVRDLIHAHHGNWPRLRNLINRIPLFREPVIGLASLAPVSPSSSSENATSDS